MTRFDTNYNGIEIVVFCCFVTMDLKQIDHSDKNTTFIFLMELKEIDMQFITKFGIKKIDFYMNEIESFRCNLL